MRISLCPFIGVGALAALALTTLAADPSPALIDFGKFTPPRSGGEFVEVNLRSNLISMAARIAEKAEPEVAGVLRGLELVRVNVIGMDTANRTEVLERVQAIRAQLDSKGWERIVTAQQQNEDVAIYLKTRGEEAVEGLVVTVIEGDREAVLVNVVGDIRPEKLAVLGERFDLEPLKRVGAATKDSATKDSAAK